MQTRSHMQRRHKPIYQYKAITPITREIKSKPVQQTENPDDNNYAIVAYEDGNYYLLQLFTNKSGQYMRFDNDHFTNWRDENGDFFICPHVPKSAIACQGHLENGCISDEMLHSFFQNTFVQRNMQNARLKIANLLTINQRNRWNL